VQVISHVAPVGHVQSGGQVIFCTDGVEVASDFASWFGDELPPASAGGTPVVVPPPSFSRLDQS
jgi:hypothetical protein